MLKQNPQRYKLDVDGVVTISASPAVRPLRIGVNELAELDPILAADGVVLQVAGRQIVGEATAKALDRAAAVGDPHYWPLANGRVRGAVMGRTIPTIRVDISGLQAAAESQSFALRQAGCRAVDWAYDDPGRVPAGVLDQINWTLSADRPRPTDRWTLSDLGLGADYSYATLGIAPPAASGRIDYEAIGEIVGRVSERMADLNEDFNRIKRVYFFGELPTGSLPEQTSQLIAIQPAEPEPDRQRLIRQTRLVRVDRGPTDRQNLSGDIVSALGAATAGPAGDEVGPAPEPAGDADRGRGVVGTAVDVAGTVIGVTTPVGLILRGLRRLFGRR